MATRRALIFGSRGALGSSLVKTLKQRGSWHTIGVDLKENADANESIAIDSNATFAQQAHIIQDYLSQKYKDKELKFDAVVCLAG